MIRRARDGVTNKVFWRKGVLAGSLVLVLVVGLSNWGLVQRDNRIKQMELLKVKMLEDQEMMMKQKLLQLEKRIQQENEQEKLQYMRRIKQEEDKLKEKVMQLETTMKYEKERIQEKLKTERNVFGGIVTIVMPMVIFLVWKVFKTRRKAEATENPRLQCVVCLDEERQVMLLDCGHMCCCRSCSLVLQTCPVCRGVIRGRRSVFLS